MTIRKYVSYSYLQSLLGCEMNVFNLNHFISHLTTRQRKQYIDQWKIEKGIKDENIMEIIISISKFNFFFSYYFF